MENRSYMKATITLNKGDVQYAADAVLHKIFSNFSSDALALTGLDYAELREELMGWKPFQAMIRKAVAAHNLEACRDPYTYLDFNMVFSTREWRKLYNTVKMMQMIADGAQGSVRVSS